MLNAEFTRHVRDLGDGENMTQLPTCAGNGQWPWAVHDAKTDVPELREPLVDAFDPSGYDHLHLLAVAILATLLLPALLSY